MPGYRGEEDPTYIAICACDIPRKPTLVAVSADSGSRLPCQCCRCVATLALGRIVELWTRREGEKAESHTSEGVLWHVVGGRGLVHQGDGGCGSGGRSEQQFGPVLEGDPRGIWPGWWSRCRGRSASLFVTRAGVTSRLTWEGGEGRKGGKGVDLSTREPPRVPSPTFRLALHQHPGPWSAWLPFRIEALNPAGLGHIEPAKTFGGGLQRAEPL